MQLIQALYYKNPHLATFHKYKHLLKNLISRDLKVKYRRSTLGFLWSVLNPLFMAFVLSAVFSNIMRIGTSNFVVFYLSGSLVFNFMNEATTGSMGSMMGAAPLIKKVYIPKYIFPAEKVLFAFVNMLFSMVALIIIMLLTKFDLLPKAVPQDIVVSWTYLLFPIPLIYVLFFSLGLGLILAAYNVFFRDLTHLYSVFVAAWMYLTPIIYPMEMVKGTIVERVMKFNPMYYYVTYFRCVVVSGTLPGDGDFINFNLKCIAAAAFVFIIGVLAFKKKQDRFILFI